MFECTKDEQYLLHRAVWHNELDTLTKLLNGCDNKKFIEQKDPRGRTPLLLAVTLGRLECAEVLLSNGADANTESRKGWRVSHEAVASGDPELLSLVLKYADYQRHKSRLIAVAELFSKLEDTADFYIEMKWEFTSWVPLVSRMCPSNSYRIYKKGGNVRIDTELINLDLDAASIATQGWKSGGEMSFICTSDGDNVVIEEVHHSKKVVHRETVPIRASAREELNLDLFHPASDYVSRKLTTPMVTTYMDTDRVAFDWAKSGIFGLGSGHKVEDVHGYSCKVFTLSNVELVTKTRTEHLTEIDKQETKNMQTPVDAFLNTVPLLAGKKEHATSHNSSNASCVYSTNPGNVTVEEYFNPYVDLTGRDIGRPVELETKTQSFSAKLWLAEGYPLSLVGQVTPFINLLASNNSHFARLKDFFELQLPSGFPVKMEIPLYHVLNARVTFENIFGEERPVKGVMLIKDEHDVVACVLEDDVFNIAGHQYSVVDTSLRRPGQVAHGFDSNRDEEELFLQLAIQESLQRQSMPPFPVQAPSNADIVGVPPVPSAADVSSDDLTAEDILLARAINDSMQTYYSTQRSMELSRAMESSGGEDGGGAIPLESLRAEATTSIQGPTQPFFSQSPVPVPSGIGAYSSVPGGHSSSTVGAEADYYAADSVQLSRILAQSAEEELERQERLRRQEEEELERVLQMSLQDK